MAILPIRGLGSIGIITDINAYDLPSNAFSMGNNVRFQNGKVTRAPAFKSVLNTTVATPVFTFTYQIADLSDKLGIVNSTGAIYFYSNGVEDDVTPGSFTPVASADPFSFCSLGNVAYLNRNSAVPMYYSPSSTDFDELPNWPATYTCKVLRAFKSYLVALNITKAGVTNPTMVKWSDITVVNSYPTSWDETDPTLSAGENTLADLVAPIIDGLALRDAFVIYTKNQAQLMEYTADQQVFRFRPILNNRGIINANCVVEVDGKHFVFGEDDIYVHDSISSESIIEGKNKAYVFNNLNRNDYDKCYVVYNQKLLEIMFCYLSGDVEANFIDVAYANKAAVFNIKNGSWSFRDLPNAPSASTAALEFDALTYITVSPATYDSIGGSYYSLEANAAKTLYFVSPLSTPGGLTASRLYGYDDIYAGSLAQDVTVEATKSAFIERIGIDMDELGEQIRGYKSLKSMYPQGRTLGGTANMTFSFGATLYNDEEPTMSTGVAFDPSSSHKVDISKDDKLVGGRYLAWRMDDTSLWSFELSGFDVDATVTGRR